MFTRQKNSRLFATVMYQKNPELIDSKSGDFTCSKRQTTFWKWWAIFYSGFISNICKIRLFSRLINCKLIPGLFFNFFCKMFYRFSSKSPDFLFCCCFLFIVCFHILATCRLVAPESKPIIQRRLMLVPCETK